VSNTKTISVYSVKNTTTGRLIYVKDPDRKRAERLLVSALNNRPGFDYKITRGSIPNPEYVPA